MASTKSLMFLLIRVGLLMNRLLAYDEFNCKYDVDIFNCININCSGKHELVRIPADVNSLMNASLGPNQLLCSIDLRETGIYEINQQTIENINLIYNYLAKSNSNHKNNAIKLLVSNISEIGVFSLVNVNIVLYISDSAVTNVRAKSLQMSSAKLEVNLVNVTLTTADWLNLLDSANLKLLSLRNMPDLASTFKEEIPLHPIASIIDVRIYSSQLPPIDSNFYLFNVLAYVEQLELVDCSISHIQENIFLEFNAAFSHLRVLVLANNRLERISGETFNGLDNLIILDLDDNPIEFIEANAFEGLVNLRTLSLSGNVKLFELLQQPVWLSVFLFNSSSPMPHPALQEINLKNKLWLDDFCLIQLFTRLNLNSLSDFYINEYKSNKHLKLFYEPEILSDNLFVEDDKAFCNLNFMCHNQIYYSKTVWSLDIESLCARIENIEKTCFYYKMSSECNGHQAEMNRKIYEPKLQANKSLMSFKTPCSRPRKLMENINIRIIIFFVICFIVMLIVLTLAFFYYCSNDKDGLDMQDKAKRELNVDAAKVNAKHYGNEYFVLLLTSDQVKN